MSGVYIHIPFCKSRCVYCGFYSTTMLPLRDSYVEALCAEMRRRAGYLAARTSTAASMERGVAKTHTRVSTVYMGGGTPSQLSVDNMRRLFGTLHDVYDVDGGAEITVECNPDDIDGSYASMLRQLGVNRISLGAQTFSDKYLRFMGRRHTARQVEKAVDILRHAGFGNISIDIMFGFPSQTVSECDCDIRRALSLEVEHISAYGLTYEEGTPLYDMLRRGEIKDIDEETYIAMYDDIANSLTGAGYEHYEISNFARPGRRSRHNSGYWHGVPYIGLGAAAHSFDTLSRQWNIANVREYISRTSDGGQCSGREALGKETMYNELVMTALRTCEGISVDRVGDRFGKDCQSHLLRCAEKYISNGVLVIGGGFMHLSRKGIFISDAVMSDLMMT